jgi:hypothetical protein
MEAIRSSETSVYAISTRRHIPEDGILHIHRRENLKSYMYLMCLLKLYKMCAYTSSNKRTQQIKNRGNVKEPEAAYLEILLTHLLKNACNYGIKQYFRTADIKIYSSECDVEIIMNVGWVF